MDKEPDKAEELLARLEALKAEERIPDLESLEHTERGLPSNFGGVWTPGWC